MKTLENATSQENWQEVIAHQSDVLLEGIDICDITFDLEIICIKTNCW